MAQSTPSSSLATPVAPIFTPDSGSEEQFGSENRLSNQFEDGVELRRLHHGSGHEKANVEEDLESENSNDDAARGRPKRRRRVSMQSKEYSDEEEASVVQKLDRKLVLFLGFLYMLSFLDRSNIGNARIAGLEKGLSLTSSQYDWLLTAFYLTYITFEWMILLYSLIPPHIYISLCVLSWGLVASFQSFTTSFNQLLVLRGLLGITEAAFGPGVPFYMCFFYKRSELAYRVGLQISAAPLATSFASTLAWVIVKLSQNGPIEPWRLLFLVEGFPSVFTAVAAYYLIPDSPSEVRYLTAREREVATLRLRSDHTGSALKGPSSHRLNVKDILDTILDPKSYLTALMFLSVNVSFSSLPVFLPTIINSMSFSPLASQALAAPPYLFAFVFILVVSHYSDKIPDSRSIFLAGVALLSCLSYTAIALAGSLHETLGEAGSITIRYIALFGTAMGLFSSVTLIITWTLNNQESAAGKGTGLTILNLVGQCGPLIGVHLFPKHDGPLYVRGMAVCAGFMGLGVAGLAILLRFRLKRLNVRNGHGGHRPEGLNDILPMQWTIHGSQRGESDDADEGDHADEVEETLMGGGRKVARERQFRFML